MIAIVIAILTLYCCREGVPLPHSTGDPFAQTPQVKMHGMLSLHLIVV